jgi:hypothetical protein
VGTPALEACGACGLETGVVMVKMKGGMKNEYRGPRLLRNPEARCEFCEFLAMWMAQEGHDPDKDGKVGASKIVERQEDGTEKLVAMVPFTETDPRDNNLVDGTKFTFQHGMVIRAEREEGTTMKLVEIIKEGT